MFLNIWDTVRVIGNYLQSPFLLLIRLYWGYQFALTGIGKFLNLEQIASYFQTLGIPFPYLNAATAGFVELVGGSLLILGLFSRLAAIPLLFVMFIAYLTAGHEALISLFNLDPDPFFKSTAFLFTYASLLIFCFGPGKFSIDYWLSGAYKKREMP